MVEHDPLVTQHAVVDDVPEELATAGLDEPQVIGRGGFSVVYRCLQRSLDRTVAVKVLSADLDEENLERFMREQRAMGRLSGHPNIVNILQIGATASGRPFIVLQYHPRGSLDALIRNQGPLGWRDVLRLGIEVTGALETAHRAGILHRDVKPANILLSEYGEAQLTDFGIARIAGGFETRAGFITGTPAFTAPEVLSGATPSVASDLYGLAATMFCALTGHAAFERGRGESVVAQFLRITSQPIPDLREIDIPDALSRSVERGMARDPADRPASAGEFGEELCDIGRRIGLDMGEMATPVEPGEDLSRARTGHRSFGTGSTTAPPTPSSKFRPPRGPWAQVLRQRLLDTLDAAERRRLILIHAPSGYGKSTLAAQWRDELSRQGTPVAWLTVDADDNNPVWFLTHLLESIRRVSPGLPESLGQVLEEHGDDADRYVLTTLIEEIHDKGEQITLVIDDWHRVSDARAVAALAFLLENGCHHLQVIVTSWSLAGLPVSRLRMLDELVEIDADALRFGANEAESLLNEVGGLGLPADDVAALATSTDGWAVALQLAALSLRRGGDAHRLVHQLSGVSDVIDEFLAENVLDALEPEVLEFLLATSITQRTCGGLASELAQVPRGQAMIEEVERRGLFLKRIPDDPAWFRYHDMAAKFLRRRLERDRPEQVERLHRTASEWFAEHGCLNEAVDHALAADDPTRAVELVEQDENNLLEQSKMTTFLGIVQKLPTRMVVSRARLQLAIAWCNSELQRPAPCYVALNRFEEALDRSGLSATVQADLRAEADVVRAIAEAFTDHLEHVDALLAEAMSRPGTLPPRAAGAAGNIAALAASHRFDFDAAHRIVEWTEPYVQMRGPFAIVYSHCFDGIAARFQLDIPLARKDFQEAYEVGSKVGPHSHAELFAGALLGQLLYETGELASAMRLLDESYQFGSFGSGVDYLIARYVTGARIKAVHGDHDAARDRLAAGMKAAEQLELPRLAGAINNERIRLGIEVAPEVAARLRSPRTIPHDDGIATMTAELDEDSGIRLLSAGDSADDHEQACRRAADLLAGINGERRPLAALSAELLLVETLIAAGRPADARLSQVSARCAELGLSRWLIDAGFG